MDGGERSAVGVYTCEIGQLRAPVSGNEARRAGWGGRPARWSASFGNDRGVVSWPAPVNLADNGAWPGPSLVHDCRAAAATLDGQLRRRRSRHHMKTSCGLSGMVLEWFRSYLVGRHQYVRIRSSSASTLMLILCGVPQRSVLGPILFCTPPTLYC